MKRAIIIFLGLTLTWSVSAQNEIDALRYSQYDLTGSARYIGMGGAMGAIGNDLSAMSVNPAGAGVFYKSEIGFSNSVESVVTDAVYIGQASSDSRLNANFSNAGFLARFKLKDRTGAVKPNGWKSFSFGLTYNRLQNFNRTISLHGTNNTSSALDDVVYNSNISGLDPFSGNLAWESYLMDTAPGGGDDYVRSVLPNYGEEQRLTETSKGSLGQLDLVFGSNYSNTLFIGGSIGYQNLSYRVERTYEEIAPSDSLDDFIRYKQTNFLRASGAGFNAKFGLIYRPLDWLRLGASVHSPTFYSIDENYSANIESRFDSISFQYGSPEGTYSYNLQTPFRAIGSIAFVIAKKVVISGEYEYIDYSAARLKASDYTFSAENENVRNLLHPVGNIRTGVEVKLGTFFVRGGFGLNGDPYTGKYGIWNSKYSLGFGYRSKHFTVNLAYQLKKEVGDYVVYDTFYVDPADLVINSHTVSIGIGLRF